MDNYDATEQAYKNGYAKGYEDGKASRVQATMFFVKAQHPSDIDMMEKLMSGPAILPVGNETIIPIMPGRWIPVTERLPESKTKILVYGGNKLIWVNGVNKPMPSVYTGYMRGLDEGWFTWDEQKYIANVTHWMPLPEPPREEQ